MSTSMLRLPSALLLAAALGVALSGCAGASYPVFEQEQTADDLLPTDFPVETDEYDLSTTRHVGSHEGVEYFLVKRNDNETGGAPCVVVVGDDPYGSIIGCSGGDGRVTVGPGGGSQAALAPAGEAVGEAEGWTRVGDYIAVRDPR